MPNPEPIMENDRAPYEAGSTQILTAFLADPKNPDRFKRFAEKYRPRIKVFCSLRGLQDADADDVAANILLRFLDRDVFAEFVFQGKEKFYHWLSNLVRNAVLTFLRGRGRKPDGWSLGNTDAQDALQQVIADIADDVESRCAETQGRIDKAFVSVRQNVQQHTWEAFHLVVVEKCKVPDVEQRLNMTKTSVWQAVSRVKRLLREELADVQNQE